MGLNTLGDILVKIQGRIVSVYGWPVVQLGIGPDGKPVPFAAGADGSMQTSPASSQDTLDSRVISASETLADGTKLNSFAPSDDFTGTVNGMVVSSAIGSFDMNASSGNTLPAIPIVVTAGTLTYIGVS